MEMTLQATDACIEVQKSSHLFGKEAQLGGLKNKQMNRMLGLCKGFLA